MSKSSTKRIIKDDYNENFMGSRNLPFPPPPPDYGLPPHPPNRGVYYIQPSVAPPYQPPLAPHNQPYMAPHNQPPLAPHNQPYMAPHNQPPLAPHNQPYMAPHNQPPLAPHIQQHPAPPPYYTVPPNGQYPVMAPNGVIPAKERPHRRESKKTGEKRSRDKERQRKKRDNSPKKISIFKRISNGIVFGLESFFYRLGLLISCYPKTTIALAILIPCLLGIGLIRYNNQQNFEGLLIPAYSRIHVDKEWIEDHIPITSRYVQFIVVNDNILKKRSLLAMLRIYRASLEIQVDGFGLSDFCTKILGNCHVTSILDLWDYDRDTIQMLTDEEIQEQINTVELNPRYYTEFNATVELGEKIFDSNGSIVAARATKMVWHLTMNSSNEEMLQKFEEKLVELGTENHAGLEDVFAFRIDAFEDEFFAYVTGDLLLLVFGGPAVFIYMVLSMGKFNMVENGLFLVIAALFGVGLAALSCYGLGLAVGLPFGVTHQGLLFLLLGIGVDDAFVVIETWKRMEKEHPDMPIEEKMAITMKHAGVSVTVTSISDFAAFAAGISTIMPILSSFCVYGTIGIFALFVVQSTFFPACLTLDQKRIQSSRSGCVPCYTHKNYKPNKYSNKEFLAPFFKKVWGPACISGPGKVISLLVSAGLLGVMSWSITNLEKGFDIQTAIHESSYVRQYIDANRRYFPGDGAPFAVYCDTSDYFAYHKQLVAMEESYKTNPAIQNGQVLSWIRPFKIWLQYIQLYGDPVVLDDDGFPEEKEVFDEYLYNFIHTSGFGGAYKSFIDVTNSSGGVNWSIYRLQLILNDDAYINDERLKTMRGYADNANTDGTCFAYGDAFVFIETVEYVDRELIRNFLLAGAAVFIVVFLLVVDLRSSFFVLSCVVYTTICLGGTLHFLDITIDGNIVILATFCIGLSVDFSAHIAYMFMTVKGTRNERAQKSLEYIGPAIFHGAMSTFLVAVVLVAAKSYTMYLFFCVLTAIMVYGLLAGLCLLPVVLSLIGPDPYPDAEDFKAPASSHIWYRSELMSRRMSLKIPRPQLVLDEHKRVKRMVGKKGEYNPAYTN